MIDGHGSLIDRKLVLCFLSVKRAAARPKIKMHPNVSEAQEVQG